MRTFSKIKPFLFRWRRVLSAVAVVASFPSNAPAQNLVPNPSFEDHSGCIGGVDWQGLSDWITPGAAPDYLHECNNGINPSFGVPSNIIGYQNAHSGSAHIAFSTYTRNINPNHTYATSHLTTPLSAGTEYCVRIWINLLEGSEVLTHQLHGLFTDTMPSTWQEADTAWAAISQVIFTTASVDTASWFALDGTFTATGGEEYFTFGNFLADTLSPFTPIAPPFYRCTFVIDDVWVGSCDVGLSETGMDQLISVYPNPVQSGTPITLQIGRTGEPLSVEIFDPQSRLVSAYQFAHPTEAIEILPQALVPGVYTISIDQRGHLRQVRLVVN